MIKVLVVDDDALTRLYFSRMLSKDTAITVVGTAKDGIEALEKIESLNPDVVTMDVLMPGMDGITALSRIMGKHPLPVIMVSAITSEDANATLQALELGAVDFITKDDTLLAAGVSKMTSLANKIKAVAHRRVVSNQLATRPKSRVQRIESTEGIETTSKRKFDIISIGASTGGPKVLQQIVTSLSLDLPVPVVIAQHMPASFTGPFAERLNELSLIEVKEARDGEPLRPGVVFVAPGGRHLRVVRGSVDTVVTISKDKEEYVYCPSVDALMSSVARCFPGKVLGIILTGMGDDGLKGLREVKQAAGRVIAQNQESCVVYGMPKAVVDAGIADQVLSPDEIAAEINSSV